jgi:LuxR family maltose regulon positive regulatory protein
MRPEQPVVGQPGQSDSGSVHSPIWPAHSAEARQLGPPNHQETPFFRSKFQIPNDPRHFLVRPRLRSLLSDLAAYPVTVVVAPAGTGKTTLAADQLHHTERPCCWLTLDAADHEPGQFRRSVTEALDSLWPAADTGTPDAAGTTATLVIDDLHHLSDERSQAALSSLLDARPAPVRLMLLSRNRMPLHVDRLRASGEVADVRFESLQFTPDEARLLLSQLCPDLSSQDMTAAVDRADGWAAALNLTALSIRSARSRTSSPRSGRLAAPDKLIDEYLWQVVLRGERPELIRMLLATAVVGRLNYDLAEVLTGRHDAGELLEEAEDRGLFVTSLEDGGWFQVHSLVRDMLMAKYRRRWPMGLREQHARAARWFESQGDDVTALEHWRQAGRPDAVLRVLSHAALDLARSRQGELVARVVDEIPLEVAGSSTDALTRYAWCCLMVDRARFEDTLSSAETVISDADPCATSRLKLLQGAAASLAGDWELCEKQVRPVLDTPPTDDRVELVEPFARYLMALGVALSEQWEDDEALVRRIHAAVSRCPEERATFESARALGLALTGHPLHARSAVARCEAGAQQTSAGECPPEHALAEAIVAAELGERAAARRGLEELSEKTTYPVPSIQFKAALELTDLSLAAGDLAAAGRAFGDAEALFADLAHPDLVDLKRTTADDATTWLSTSLARAGVGLSLARDDVEAATSWSRRVADPFWGPWCEATIDLAEGNRRAATEALAQAKPRCVRHDVMHQLGVARAVLGEDRAQATALVGSALATAAGSGLLQTVATTGIEVVELIELEAWRVPDVWMEQLRHFLVPQWVMPVAGPTECLTEREREVLRLLPSRLTLREVASQLYVSQNTLKFHLRAIYRKLDVDCRTNAVEAARQRGMLPSN